MKQHIYGKIIINFAVGKTGPIFIIISASELYMAGRLKLELTFNYIWEGELIKNCTLFNPNLNHMTQINPYIIINSKLL